MQTLSPEYIRERLKTCIDPELGINIVDLGLIYDIQIRSQEEKKPVYILMTLTTPGCPLAGVFHQMVRDALYGTEGLNPEKDVEIDLTFDPPWVTDMMSEEAKAELGL